MSQDEIAALQQQIALLQQQNAAQAQQQQLARTELPELTYNPIEETVGPDGKKTIALRKELQLTGPEAFIERERQRLEMEKAGGLDQLRQEQAQKEAQQRAMMMTRGGLKGGASPLARYSMRDALAARQGLLGQQAKMGAEFESAAEKMRKATEERNINELGRAITGVETFNLERWKKMKDVEASKTQAEATRAAGQGGKK
jgi:hypothetical protein